MTRRTGFTLLELIVAIVLAGVVALLVYGAADAGRNTEARLRERRRVLQTARGFRATLEDALRNARPSRVYGDTAFRLDVRRDARGHPADRLWFVTAGGLPPLTGDADWEVSLEPSADGVVLAATPVGMAEPVPVVIRYPGVTAVEVRVLGFGRPPSWTDRWTFPALVPTAIQLTYWSDSGPHGAPVRLVVPLGGVQ